MAQHSAQTRPAVIKPLAESLWFPMLFFFGFLFCYLLAFHSPAPHDVTVAVSDPKTAAVVQAELSKAVPGGFRVTAEPNAAAAKQAVLDRTAYAGFATDTGRPTLYVAKANGYSLEQIITQVFTPMGGPHLVVTDLAPTAAGDAIGTGLFYFNGAGVLRPVLVLAAWIVLGVALIGLDVLIERRRTREPVAEPPVEDPALEMPEPTALPAHAHHFGGPTPMLAGHVNDEHERPVAGVPVTVTGTHGRQLVRTTTDRLGAYAVTGLPDGFVDVVVSAHDQQPAVHRVLIREGRATEEDFVVRDRELVTA